MDSVIVMPPACARPEARTRITGEITAHRADEHIDLPSGRVAAPWAPCLALLAAAAGEVVR